MASGGLQVPPSLKPIAPYINIANMHASKNPVIAYWCKLHALEKGLKLNKSNDDRTFLMSLVDGLEKTKKQNLDDEAYSNDLVAQSHIEAHALKLFNWADQQDKNSNFDSSVVRAFHTAGYLFDVLESCGEVSEENQRLSRYAKCKAADIHRCLKEGRPIVSGPFKGDDEGFEEDGPAAGGGGAAAASNSNARASGPVVPAPTCQGIVPDERHKVNVDAGPPQMPQQPSGMRPVMPQVPSVTQITRQPTKNESLGAYPKLAPTNTSTESVATPLGITAVPGGALPSISTDQVVKAQKYCKYANSALTYEDVDTAVLNLRKALSLLTTGVDSQ